MSDSPKKLQKRRTKKHRRGGKQEKLDKRQLNKIKQQQATEKSKNMFQEERRSLRIQVQTKLSLIGLSTTTRMKK
jgi:hypothetical protein